MKLTISTSVERSLEEVWAGFNEALFQQLSPPFPPVKVLRFDGCQKNDVVELELNFLGFKQRWKSLITDQQTSDKEIFFVDEGITLPFFLAYWHHKHRLLVDGNHTIIRDEIEFKTPSLLTDYLIYPLLHAQFAYRKPIYRRRFSLKER